VTFCDNKLFVMINYTNIDYINNFKDMSRLLDQLLSFIFPLHF
jgi:hypothetical protein